MAVHNLITINYGFHKRVNPGEGLCLTCLLTGCTYLLLLFSLSFTFPKHFEVSAGYSFTFSFKED